MSDPVQPPPSEEPSGGRAALIAMLLAIVAIFGFIMPMVYAPAFYATPIVGGSVISPGVIGGALLMCFLVVLAAIYTRKRNKADRP